MTRSALIKGSVLLATALVSGLVAFLATDAGAAGTGHPRAWIDDPLHGEVLTPGPVSVVAHAYDPAGVTEMVLLVDGQEVETTIPDGSGQQLVNIEWSWVPADEGIYVLEVLGRNSEGVAGLTARAVIEVHTPASPPDLPLTPTTAPELTTTTTTTVTTTTTTTVDSTTTSLPGRGTTSSTAPETTTTTAAPVTTTTTPTTTAPPPPCTPPAPILLSPSNDQNFFGPSPSITLTWSGWRGAPPACPPSGFYAEVATDAGFGNVLASAHIDSATEWAPNGSIWWCNTTHYWRVTSKRSDRSLANQSSTWKIVVQCVT